MLQDGVAGKILGGWLVSGIYSARSGRPFTVTQGNNNVGAGMTGLPNLTGDPEGRRDGRAVVQPGGVHAGAVGHVRQRRTQHPARAGLDHVRHEPAAPRSTSASRVNATLRWDIFNVFNRANFGLPQRNIASATAGVISTLAGDPRVMQLSLRWGSN